MVKVSVILPFRGDAPTLRWALDGFAAQRLPANVAVDIRVGGDGCAPPAYVPPAASSDARIRFTLLSLPRSGVAGTKNLLIENIQSDVLIFANADTRPDANFIAAHVARLLSLSKGFMVLGSAPYEPSSQKSVFDALKEESPAIFFYDRLEPNKCYDYRHAWNLNVSVRHGDFQKAGGFCPLLRPYGYEDLDFAFKVMGEKAAIFYDPAAIVTHRHPMSLDQYLDREEALGSVAPVLSRTNPQLFHSLLGRRDLDALASEYRIWTAMDIESHRWIYRQLSDWVTQPDRILGDPGSEHRKRQILTLYQMHIPLKRLAFRLGFLRGLDLIDDSRWLDRGPQGLWKQAIH